MKTLVIKNPKQYHQIIVRSIVKPKIVSNNEDYFYFHAANREHLCIEPDCPNIDYVIVELANNGYIQLWDNMTLLE